MEQKKSNSKRVGRKKGIKKSARFLGYKYTPEEYLELKKVFENYKKINGLSTTKAIKKIILQNK